MLRAGKEMKGNTMIFERKLFFWRARHYSAQLTLNGSLVGDDGAAELAKLLASNTTLTTVCSRPWCMMHWGIWCDDGMGDFQRYN